MIVEKHFNKLSGEQVLFLSQFSNESLYKNETQIIYSGQIPIASYILIEGKIILRDAQKRIVKTCQSNVLIGFKELFNKRPYKYTVDIEAGSKVIVLDRSAILKIQNQLQTNLNKSFEAFNLIK